MLLCAVRTFTVLCLLVFSASALAAENAPPTPPERPLDLEAHPDAVEVALDCVCGSYPAGPSRDRCKAARTEQVRKVVSDLLWVVDQRKDEVPAAMRPLLISIGCGESALRNRPTCGADAECMKECGTSQACILKCGGRKRCNDRGTSAGMFQIKRADGLAPLYERLYGEPLNFFDHLAVSSYYLDRVLYGVENTVPAFCGKMDTLSRWDAATYRIGRGPVVVPARKAQRVCGPVVRQDEAMTTVECIHIPARREVPRCVGSKYASRARTWYERAPDVWRLVPVESMAQGEEALEPPSMSN